MERALCSTIQYQNKDGTNGAMSIQNMEPLDSTPSSADSKDRILQTTWENTLEHTNCLNCLKLIGGD